MKLLTLASTIVIAGCQCSCNTVLPENTSVSGKSGKQALTVDVSKQTLKEGLKKLGITILQMFVKSAVSYTLEQAGNRMGILTDRSGK